MVNLLYPRFIDVHRSRADGAEGATQTGLVGYAGREQSAVASDLAGEIVLFTGVPANIIAISAASGGRSQGGLMPSDVSTRSMWQILISNVYLAQYSIRDRDIIIDDEQYRYGVVQNYWTLLGYQLSCLRLEA